MSLKELIAEYLEQERNNVFNYSANYRMDQPKKGYEREFRSAKERVILLEYLIKELK